MATRVLLPPGLPAEIGRPLLATAERIAQLKPWETMSDLHLIGLRVEGTGELQVASILGALRQVFAIVIYRHDAGLRWIHEIATTGQPPSERDSTLESLDYLKIEWAPKRELRKPDLDTLANARCKPKGKGAIWPRLESGTPGWYPWFPSEEDARLLAAQLEKILRFIHLFRRVPGLYEAHVPGEVPVVPAGEELSLEPEALEWLPLLPKPAPPPDPIQLSTEERAGLGSLPQREDFVFELVAPLMPELSFLDENAGRPCIARAGLIIDRRSHFIFATELAHGAAPLSEAVKQTFVKGLQDARVRPGAIHVPNERLAAVVNPACEAIGVKVHVVETLDAAYEALDALSSRFTQIKS